MSYGKFYSPAKAESDQKDIIIAQLKADIFELRKSEEDYYILQEELRKMELKIKLMIEERISQDSEYRGRHEQALKQINHLRNEIDQLQQQIRSRLQEIDALKQENLQLSELCDLRQVDLQNAKRDYNKAKDEVINESDLFEKLQDQQQLFDEEARAMHQKNLDLQRGIEEINRKVKDKERILARIEDELNKLNGSTQQQEQNYQDYTNQITRINQDLKSVENQNIDVAKQMKNQEQKVLKLRQDLDTVQNDAQRHSKNYQIELQRNQETQNRFNQLDAMNQQRDNQIEDYETELNTMTEENDSIRKSNNQMKDDFDGLRKHIDVLMSENTQLIIELENYCDDDDQVRAILNRRSRIKELAKRVESTMRLNYKHSPVKSNQQKQSFQGSGSKGKRSNY